MAETENGMEYGTETENGNRRNKHLFFLVILSTYMGSQYIELDLTFLSKETVYF